jgi:hypothetical protein
MPNIRMMSLNLHCLEEENLLKKYNKITTEIINKKVDIILFQEVAQSINMPYVDNKTLKEDNSALQI